MTSRPVVRTFRVGCFQAEITVPRIEPGTVSHVQVEWSPRVPDFDTFTAEQRAEYSTKLLAAISEVAP
jgi:hypothetical protein